MKIKKILITGLPGSGKTTLASKLNKLLKAKWINADQIRRKFNDWDFSPNVILRQAKRMRDLADKEKKKSRIVIADFICPLEKGRKLFKPDFTIWMNTIKKGRFKKKSIDKYFQTPKKCNFEVKTKNSDLWSICIADKIRKYVWNNKKPTAQMLGRFQPWHKGHKILFEEIIKKTGQVIIEVKDVKGVGDNPYSFKSIKKKIDNDLKNFKSRYKIIKVPNVSKICYGRTVGYSFEKINLPQKIQLISATKIRKNLRKLGKLKKLKL